MKLVVASCHDLGLLYPTYSKLKTNTIMSIVTIFDYYKKPVVRKPLVNILYQIKTGRFKKLINQLRYYDHNGFDRAFEALKKVIPQFTVSGNFKMERDRLELVSYSGFLLMEIPYLNDKDLNSVKSLLIQDPFVSACFVNAVGSGLVFLVHSSMDSSKHEELFRYAVNYYKQLTGVEDFSMKGIQPTHTCMFSLDEDAYIEFNAVEFSPLAKATN